MIITAKEGYTFVRKSTGMHVGQVVILGVNDKPSNYRQVKIEENEENDNIQKDMDID